MYEQQAKQLLRTLIIPAHETVINIVVKTATIRAAEIQRDGNTLKADLIQLMRTDIPMLAMRMWCERLSMALRIMNSEEEHIVSLRDALYTISDERITGRKLLLKVGRLDAAINEAIEAENLTTH